MNYKYSDITLIQFAKAPNLGRVKTRMAPVLSEVQCLELHQALTSYVATQLYQSAVCPQELWVGSEPEHPFFLNLCSPLTIPIYRQVGQNLGDRMHHAAETLLGSSQAVIIVGSDCPFLDENYIEQAALSLYEGTDVVLGPAIDGGYVLLGLRSTAPRLFDGIPWGTDGVYTLTKQRILELGWRLQELAPLADIDRPEDLERLKGVDAVSLAQFAGYAKRC